MQHLIKFFFPLQPLGFARCFYENCSQIWRSGLIAWRLSSLVRIQPPKTLLASKWVWLGLLPFGNLQGCSWPLRWRPISFWAVRKTLKFEIWCSDKWQADGCQNKDDSGNFTATVSTRNSVYFASSKTIRGAYRRHWYPKISRHTGPGTCQPNGNVYHDASSHTAYLILIISMALYLSYRVNGGLQLRKEKCFGHVELRVSIFWLVLSYLYVYKFCRESFYWTERSGIGDTLMTWMIKYAPAVIKCALAACRAHCSVWYLSHEFFWWSSWVKLHEMLEVAERLEFLWLYAWESKSCLNY